MTKRKPARRRLHKVGLPPGSLIHIGEEKLEKVEVLLITYDDQTHQERAIVNPEDCRPDRISQPGLKWVIVTGLNDVEVLEKIGHAYGLHVLTMAYSDRSFHPARTSGPEGENPQCYYGYWYDEHDHCPAE